MQGILRTNNTSVAILIAFAFKLLAAWVTVFAVTGKIAIEIAPVSLFFSSIFGIFPATIIVNLIWLGATLSSFYLIKMIIKDSRIQKIALKICMFTIITIALFDGLWDLGVFFEFNQLYVMSVLSVGVAVVMGLAVAYGFQGIKSL